jgi:hypothetical protein
MGEPEKKFEINMALEFSVLVAQHMDYMTSRIQLNPNMQILMLLSLFNAQIIT